MSENDMLLIKQAEQTSYTKWFDISDMEEKAESEECKEALHDIKVRKYHMEEGYNI